MNLVSTATNQATTIEDDYIMTQSHDLIDIPEPLSEAFIAMNTVTSPPMAHDSWTSMTGWNGISVQPTSSTLMRAPIIRGGTR